MRGKRSLSSGSSLRWWLTGAVLSLPLVWAMSAGAAEGGVDSLDKGGRKTDRVEQSGKRGGDSSRRSGGSSSGTPDRSASYYQRWRDYDGDNYRHNDWDSSPSRLQISFGDGRGDNFYFNSLGQAMLSLNSEDEWPRLRDWQVVDFASYDGRRPRMIDAHDAYYLVDSDWTEGFYDEPSILAFYDRREARRFQRELGGRILGFDDAFTVVFDWGRDNYWNSRRDDHWDNHDRWDDRDRGDDCDWHDRDHDRGRHRGRGRGHRR